MASTLVVNWCKIFNGISPPLKNRQVVGSNSLHVVEVPSGKDLKTEHKHISMNAIQMYSIAIRTDTSPLKFR